MFADTQNPRNHVVEEVCLSDLLNRVLENFAQDMLADTVAVYAYSQDLREAVLLASTPNSPHPQMVNAVEKFCATGELSVTLKEDELPDATFASAQFVLFRLYDEPLGALVLLSHSKAVDHLSHPGLRYHFAAIEAMLQNQNRSDCENTLRAVQELARQVGEGATPQDLITIFGEQLLSPQIRFCSMLLFGPRREDRPNGPYAYLDMQGVWSNRLGPGVGLGMRLYLDQYADLVQKLEDRKMWHIPDVRAIEGMFDPLVRGFIRNAGVHSMALFLLESGGRNLGIMTIGTEPDYEFTQQDLRTYQTISEFLGLKAMSHVLKQEEDYVLRGRAALLEAMTDGVLMVLPSAGSMTGDTTKTSVLTINQAFTDLFGITQIRAQGLTLPQLLEKLQLPEEVRQNLTTHWLATSMRDPLTQRGDFAMIHPDGYHTTIGWYNTPVTQGGRIIGRIFVFHNVMDDHSAVSLRANFVSRMSHELRTPLTSIKGFAQYMLEELNDSLTPAVRDYLEIILDNSQLLNTLFSEIIEITRADVGDLKLNIGPSHLTELIEQVAIGFEVQGAKEHKWIELQLAQNLPPALIDTNYISRVLTLLLRNAFQHAPPDSQIRISTQIVDGTHKLPFGAPSDVTLPCVVITVEDQGDGIAAEDAELIFQPFYRTRDARVARLEGSGLGLALARSILTLHRGKIWAEPRRRGRRGARVYFSLPIATEKA